LLIVDWKNKELDSCWSLHLIYSDAGMIREINDYKQEMSFPRKRESINLKE